MGARDSQNPRFTVGQQVRVIANMGGLYAAQIGVTGVISKQRQKRRYGYRSYDVTYTDAKGREKIVIVREDDLEEVPDATLAQPPSRFTLGQKVKIVSDHAGLYSARVGRIGRIDGVGNQPGARWHLVSYAEKGALRLVNVREDDLEPVEEPPTPLRPGQRVTVHPPTDGAEDEYPSFTHYPIVGEIVSMCQVTASGLHCYDVRFPRIVRGISSEWWPPVSIREAHLTPEPSLVGWLAQSAASMRKAEHPVTPLPQPKFSVGEHVTVDPRSALAYETFTRKGAIGVIVEVGKPVRGIRRYEVHFPAKGSRQGEFVLPSHIREEHLVKAEAPAPQPETPAACATPRHACEYRKERIAQGLSIKSPLWCDKGGCFEDDCVVCQQTPEWRMRHGLKPPARLRRHEPECLSTPLANEAMFEQLGLWGIEAQA